MLYNDVLFEEGILREGEEISKDTSTDRKTNEEEEEDSEKGKPRWSHRFTLETLRWSLSVHIILLLRAWAKTALSPISVTAALTEEDRSPSLSSLHSSEDLYDTPDALQETETSIEREAIRQSLIYAARAAAALTDSNPWRSSVAATPPTETQSPEGFSPLEEEEDKEETPLSAHPLDFTDAPPELVEQLQNQPAAVAVSAEASEGSEGLSRSSMRGGDLSSLARLVASVCPEGENEHLSLDLLRSLPRTRPDLRDPSAVSSLTEEFKRWQRTLATMRAGKVAKRRRGKKKRKEEAEKENPDVASAGAEAAEDAPPRTGPSTPSPQKTSPSSSASPPSFIVDEALPLMDAWQPSSLAPGPGGESGPERERQMRERQPQLANMSS
uniref:Uncharacterized protein n=2 Tax=Chromera velia CCMP2878 TaxID=1169474 RepID=A0A0K6S8W3_9ALVE|eukprot:Cvel_26635.t1-p1 / transcript=Cvel_26635.t1 / gene=Cvel_26635 / organism=Chromera_velia_CCMP2878 / gene_product=hypothetical protein / transcript_product=hypothetical protein / location=Cvel_scaffold3200:13708-14856(-) / protein_length=383 / sequence_SO=supercontig / SO=protein_coding / is_pseudo=false